MRRCIAGLAATLLLLSCSAAPKMDPLEAKAQTGDAVAACQFAARNLHSCALEKQKWERGLFSQRPACIDTALGEKEEAYLDKAMAGETGAAYVMFLVQRTSLVMSAVQLAASPADEVVKSTEELLQKGASLHHL